eukprot:TRINITY_DN71097_c0_g1_i1.p1 TRINITY_DN71097_c0_g1~~TRINITY_DN71097_c0_g1_i1.p1  ORF type:complete len:205 (+),score=21.09 TRINITY_DN71097_c0_g1_i1:84-698(+)
MEDTAPTAIGVADAEKGNGNADVSGEAAEAVSADPTDGPRQPARPVGLVQPHGAEDPTPPLLKPCVRIRMSRVYGMFRATIDVSVVLWAIVDYLQNDANCVADSAPHFRTVWTMFLVVGVMDYVSTWMLYAGLGKRGVLHYLRTFFVTDLLIIISLAAYMPPPPEGAGYARVLVGMQVLLRVCRFISYVQRTRAGRPHEAANVR